MTAHKDDKNGDNEHENELMPRRGPGRPPKARDEPEEKEHEAKAKEVTVTYKPVDHGDPHDIEWNGHKFEANVPRKIAAVHKEMIEQAKGNPWFEVEGHPRAKRVSPYTGESVPLPGSDVDPIAFDDRKMVEGD